MATSFVPLRCRSNYSFLHGAATLDQLLERAARSGMAALGLADLGGLYGAVQFFLKAREYSIKPIIGVELEIEAGTILFIAKSLKGYGNLCRLSTIAKLEERTPTIEDLALYSGDVISVFCRDTACRVRQGCRQVPSPDGPMSKPLAVGSGDPTALCMEEKADTPWRVPTEPCPEQRRVRRPDATITPHTSGAAGTVIPETPSVIERAQHAAPLQKTGDLGAVGFGDPTAQVLALLREIFGDDLYIGLESFGDLRGEIRARKALAMAQALDIKTVAANSIAFMEPADFATHRVLRAIGEITPIDQLPDDKCESPEAYFRNQKDTRKLFSQWPEALQATVEIAEKCDLQLPVGRLNFPTFETKDGKTNARLLYELASAGLARRYARITGEVISRLEYELNVIERAGFVDYFLIVNDIIDYCKCERIPVVGRGSAASSIVSYCLGITEVCPIEQDLYFPRFLNEARRDPPDVDLDICWKRRDDVLEYVYERYGRDRVAMICTLNTFAVRGAVREVAKAFGLSGDEISDFTKRLPYGGSVAGIAGRVETSPECRHLPIHIEPYKSILEIAAKIEGYPRHLGIHSGGIVVAPGKLLDMAPLQMSAKGIAITQYDMYSIDDLGLVKIDLLGQRGLSTIEEARDIVGRKTGVRPETIPEGDSKTYDLLCRGRTVGVFQIESPGLRALLIAMRPKALNDITLALALIRPGASESGMKKIFLERLFGRVPVEYPHPSLEPVLRETLGNIIYQEQVMKVASALAGFTPEQGDLLRSAMTKDWTRRDFSHLREAFFKQASRRGVASAVAAHVFDMMAQFASYGFCKAHAATYAALAYRGTYLKAHHPVEYMASMLNNFAGYYHSRVYAEEARRFGAILRTPTIDRPSDICFVDGRELYIGLVFVRNLSRGTIERIIEAREARPFTSLFDFLSRARPSKDEAESLIKCGALDCLGSPAVGVAGQTRPQLLWLQKMYGDKRLKLADDNPLLGGLSIPEPDMSFLPDLPDFTLDQKLRAESDIFEMAISCHPIERIAMGNGHVKSAELPKLENKRVKIMGYVADRKRIKTNNGKSMVFLTMEDELDMFEVTLFPEVYRRVGERIFRKPILDIEGTVQTDMGGLTVVADRVDVVG